MDTVDADRSRVTAAERDFIRYLEAKKTVDDRALNRCVWSRLQDRLLEAQQGRTVRVLEMGMGIGTMLERLVEQGLLTNASFLGVDSDRSCVQAAERRLLAWTQRCGWGIDREGRGWRLSGPKGQVHVEFIGSDDRAFTRQAENLQRYDFLIANAYLDLVPLERSLPALLAVLKEGGMFHFSVNFDGGTILLPVTDPDFEHAVISEYHRTMDERLVDGLRCQGSQSGRRLLLAIPTAGGRILAAGASDWIVFPVDGAYPADEAFFLHSILNMIERALEAGGRLDPARVQQWLDGRLRQLEQAQLIYIAHQLDVTGTVASPRQSASQR